MLLPSPESLMGPCTASHCCCLHRHTLPMCHFPGLLTHCWVPFCHRVLADYGPTHCCCQALICHGPPVPPPHAAARSTVSHGSLNDRLPLLLSPSPHCCHVPLSGLLTLLVCSIFC
ncbi:unnamed protein product, partial [Staurois parvus]